MKYLFIIIFLLFTVQVYAGFLGEYEQGKDIYIWVQINDINGEAASNATTTNISLFDKNDASSPTASGVLTEVYSGIVDGLFSYKYNGCIDDDLATGPCIARITAKINDRYPAAIHTFFVVDSGHGPNFRSILTTADNIGINWADISNKGSTVDLSATTIDTVDTATAATDVTNAVTAGTVNDKTGYSLATGQLSPIIESMEIDHDMRSTRDSSIETVIASLSTVDRKQNEIKSSIETVNTWITTDANIVQDSEIADIPFKITIADAMANIDIASKTSTYGSIVRKIDDNAASVTTIAGGSATILDSGVPNKTVIAAAMREIDVASKESVYGSIVQKIDDAGASIQTVNASLETVRSDLEDIEDEIRANR